MNSPSRLAADILAVLKEEADPQAQDAMREQYGIHTNAMFGVPMRRLLEIAKPLRANHELALNLWEEGSYEARTIAALVDDPQQVSGDQMQRWCDDFDNWAIVDTTCFRLFDQTPHAWILSYDASHDRSSAHSRQRHPDPPPRAPRFETCPSRPTRAASPCRLTTDR